MARDGKPKGHKLSDYIKLNEKKRKKNKWTNLDVMQAKKTKGFKYRITETDAKCLIK